MAVLKAAWLAVVWQVKNFPVLGIGRVYLVGNITTKRSLASRRSLTYWAYISLFLLSGGLILSIHRSITPFVHTLLDGIAVICATTAAIVVFKAFQKTRATMLAIVSIGLAGTVLFELFHLNAATTLVSGLAKSDASLLMPWSWYVGQIFLSVMMMISFLYVRQENFGGPATTRNDLFLLFTPKYVGFFALIIVLVFIYMLLQTNLPPIYSHTVGLSRAPEIVSGMIFMGIFLYSLNKGNWRTDSYGHWLNMGIVSGLIAQIFYMTFSRELLDANFTSAHILKIITYSCIIFGFVQAHHVSASSETKEYKMRGLGLDVKLALLCGVIAFSTTMLVSYNYNRALFDLVSANSITVLSAAATNTSGAIENKRLRTDDDLSHLDLNSLRIIESLNRAEQNGGIDPVSGKSRKQFIRNLSQLMQRLLVSDSGHLSFVYIDAASGKTIIRSKRRTETALDAKDWQVLESSNHELAAQALSGGRKQLLTRSQIILLPDDSMTDDSVSNNSNLYIEGTARAIYSNEMGSILGVFVLHSDVSQELTTTSLPDGETNLYVVNHNGQFIVHPDPSKEVSRSNETAYMLTDEFPGLDFNALMLDGSAGGQLYSRPDGVKFIVGFKHLAAKLGSAEPLFYIYSGLLKDFETQAVKIGDQQRQMAQIILIIAVLMGWFFARRLTNPVREISIAAVKFGRDGTVSEISSNGRDEIGMLARTLSDMMVSVSTQRAKLVRQAAALERKSDELQRSNYDLEQFAYVASHDLKAPLRAIKVLADWLKEDLEEYTEGDVQENLGLLEQRTARLSRLLDDLLAYSRAGRKVGDVREVDVKELVEDIAVLISPPEGFVIEVDESLPTMVTYHAPLETVFRNLMSNAIKHSPVPEEGRIRVYAEDQGDMVEFAIEDNGSGIPPEYAEKVFMMFQTLKARDEMEGSGMGLAIVQRIVDWQGGKIWFHEGPDNKGTVFKFTWNKTPRDMPGADKGEAPSMDDTQTLIAV